VIAYEVKLPIRRPWLALVLCLLWFPFKPFLLGFFLIVRGIIRPESSTEFFFCLIIGIPYLFIGGMFGLAILRLVLLNLFGEESLKLEEGRLMIRTGRLFTRVRGLLRFFGVLPALIFRARGRTHWFGSSLDEIQAREVLTRLKMHLPESTFVKTRDVLTLTDSEEEEGEPHGPPA